ncbi:MULTISPECIES: hypothetical protein [unclassified Paenibacillus]|uniref:hypothetical protein n=1 Tax=unclassified Paenibacillus TaxID=185978 RepID=UPI0024063F0F|nr:MULTISPECIES: hypothetical protein [unclassified Paenibacillus]MDF9842295.1 putative intracellular protease/amidase [Paenibacillus sp. PastF-2]MDF9848828.1 putative intracellular protease/amidase [Paenibacillus sp. PastM-2]MDF9855398.1 putative intracellular protease/amidase [Paenibacillus sp. PastF-1]MDH6480726.1 putative intracellular protease/amidase [Paenibacillus sp. PastH-2]MDH6508093.1 putative intracellular protease/amidase [Paenibacillus sp. PastM-3]
MSKRVLIVSGDAAVLPELMHGREYTAYPNCQPDVTACGATSIDQALHTHRILVSG